jgi:hypothetical protein
MRDGLRGEQTGLLGVGAVAARDDQVEAGLAAGGGCHAVEGQGHVGAHRLANAGRIAVLGYPGVERTGPEVLFLDSREDGEETSSRPARVTLHDDQEETIVYFDRDIPAEMVRLTRQTESDVVRIVGVAASNMEVTRSGAGRSRPARSSPHMTMGSGMTAAIRSESLLECCC